MVFTVWKRYAKFSGRARRKEYWMFVLFNFIVEFILAILDDLFKTNILYILYSLAVILPFLAVSVRRLHDIGKSGWWVLLNFVPLIGNIIIVVVSCFDSEKGANKYGQNPKIRH